MNKTSVIFSSLLMVVSISVFAAKDIDISKQILEKLRHITS